MENTLTIFQERALIKTFILILYTNNRYKKKIVFDDF